VAGAIWPGSASACWPASPSSAISRRCASWRPRCRRAARGRGRSSGCCSTAWRPGAMPVGCARRSACTCARMRASRARWWIRARWWW